MRPYKDFKNDMIKLIEYAISPDRTHGFMLKDYVGNDFDQNKANESHRCGSVACIAGYVPEVWPEIFMWCSTGAPMSKMDESYGAGTIRHFMGVNYAVATRSESSKVWYIKRIFATNNTNHCINGISNDITVAKFRLDAVRKCRSYKQLKEYIICYGQWF